MPEDSTGVTTAPTRPALAGATEPPADRPPSTGTRGRLTAAPAGEVMQPVRLWVRLP